MDLWKQLSTELNSLRIAINTQTARQLLNTDLSEVKGMDNMAAILESISLFAKRAGDIVAQLEHEKQIAPQKKNSGPFTLEGEQESVLEANVLGNQATIRFPLFNVDVQGKIDTGATTSSLHAVNVSVNKERGVVTFKSDAISNNVITLRLQGAQEVHSADHGGDTRPVVKLDIEIGGVLLKDMVFNLNDRSNMDAKLLIGQNVLKAGDFQIDVNKDSQQEPPVREEVEHPKSRMIGDHPELIEAIETLRGQQVTFDEIFRYLTTEALNKVETLEN